MGRRLNSRNVPFSEERSGGDSRGTGKAPALFSTDIRLVFAYAGFRVLGLQDSENKPSPPDRYVATVAIPALIIAAVRL